MNGPLRTDARGLRAAALRWATSLAQLRHSPSASDAEKLDRLTCGRLALQAGRGMKAGASTPESIELLVLALVNVRAAVLCLTPAGNRAASASDRAAGGRPCQSIEPELGAIVERSVVDDLSADPADVRRDLDRLLAHGERLRGELEEAARRARRARRHAWARVLAPLALPVVVGFAGWRLLRAPEVSAGKPWATSSVGIVCDPVHESCGGAHTSLLFHTLEEHEPWFEVDLGAAYELTRIEVGNRGDCCADRAVPLLVEVSLDHHGYRTVARKFAAFDHWSQRLPATQARYVRLRVMRRSILHLEQVRIYGRQLETRVTGG